MKQTETPDLEVANPRIIKVVSLCLLWVVWDKLPKMVDSLLHQSAKRMLKGPFGPGARVIDWERELNDLRERGYI